MNAIHCDDEPLSPHFRLYEFLRSEKAAALNIDNTPSGAVIEALRINAQRMELVRDVLGGKAIRINSGYRCLALNRALGSKDTSDHVKGLATDFVCAGFGTPEQICRALAGVDGLPFKQLIHEHTWVHISWDYQAELTAMPPKRQVLTLMAGGTYAPGIVGKAVV